MSFKLYTTPIAYTSDRTSKREREVAATQKLVREVFGEKAHLTHTPSGAPVIPSFPRQAISISHCSDICVLAVATDPDINIGVDIETQREQLQRVANKFLTPDEIQMTATREAFTLLKAWTAKEAVFKCALTPGLAFHEIHLHPTLEHAEARGQLFSLHYPLVTPTHVMAVALSSPHS